MQNASQHIREVFFALCKSADTPRSLGAWLRFKYGEYSDLVKAETRACDYIDATSFFVDYSVFEFLRKADFLDTGLNLQEVALDGFRKSEVRCAETNKRLRHHRSGFASGYDSTIFGIRRKISEILGPLDLASVFSDCRWGPGATVCLPRRRSRPDNKMRQLPITVTHGALPYMKAWIESDPHWFEAFSGLLPSGPYSVLPSIFQLTSCNKVITVPKSAKTDRVIAIEPRGNSFLQQGVGRYLRSRLRRHGVNLDDQTINQALAQRAIFESLATLDLSAASDSISLELVYELLPLDWALLLDRLRSPEGILPTGERLRYEKFSSMGNAYTFELESLIFFSVCRVISNGIVSVYGDDIICPAVDSARIIDCLDFLGFSVNASKSFVNGPFFESCGKHYFLGCDVTPQYQKRLPKDIFEVIRLHNRLARLSRTLYFDVKGPLSKARRWAHSIDKRVSRCTIFIDGFTDDALLVDENECSYKVQDGWFRFSVLKPDIKNFKLHSGAMFANWLRTHSRREKILDKDFDTGLWPVRNPKRYRVGTVKVWPYPALEAFR